MDRDGRLLGRRERGEIVVRGSLVSPGYYKNPEATAEARSGPWHRTGDIGYLDDDNYLFIVDRAKDMIITGGFNVYSAEIEQALLSHPSIRDCAVIGLPDDKWGERVVAVLEARPDLDVDELRGYVRERIGGVKTPKQFEIWTDLPRSKVGKVLKAEVKQLLLDSEQIQRDS
jgi:acyl-CoA synthetase (AMP-forming)/AMP-acid ligase II